MKYKYQLRGFAVGVVVAAVLMSVIFRLSETQDKSVNKEQVVQEQETQEQVSQDDLQESIVVESVDQEETKYPIIDEVVEDIVDESEVDKIEVDETDQIEIFYLQVVSGDSSVSVSNKLAELGLVPDAHEYDLYLCANGYDKKIRTGNHEIKEGATFEEIAEEISSR